MSWRPARDRTQRRMDSSRLARTHERGACDRAEFIFRQLPRLVLGRSFPRSKFHHGRTCRARSDLALSELNETVRLVVFPVQRGGVLTTGNTPKTARRLRTGIRLLENAHGIYDNYIVQSNGSMKSSDLYIFQRDSLNNKFFIL